MACDSVHNPSLCLARLLDHIIGNEDQVRITRNVLQLEEYCMNIHKEISSISSGSSGEGYNLESSDTDVMIVDHGVKVVESVQSHTEPLTHKTVLLMRRDGCQPGYVILQVLRSDNSQFVNAFVQWSDCVVLSSILLRDQLTAPVIACNSHGPCNSGNLYGVDTDFAYCFEIKQWPIEAIEYFKRPRKHGWPDRPLLDLIRRKGCHLVAIGDKTSDLVNIQWRISFAVAERMLVHSFNHTQLRVYVLMKIFHKQLIEKYDGVEDLLCSYYMKTTMFYMIEDTDPLLWREGNLITLFWRCFMKLIQWVEDGFCPNYFIPENNLFKSKIFGQNQNNLVKVLNAIKQEGWKSIYRCHDLECSAIESDNKILLNLSTDLKNIEAHKDVRVFEVGSLGLSPCNRFPFEKVWCKALKLLDISKIKPDTCNQLYTFTYRIFLGLTGQLMFDDLNQQKQLNKHSRNKDTHKSLKLCERLFLEGAKVDVSRGPLNLALFYYAINMYDKVIQICNEVLTNITPYAVNMRYYHKNINIDKYKTNICGRGMGCNEKMKKALVLDTAVNRDCKMFYPKEFQHDINALPHFVIYYPPVPFAIFLKFLCFHERGDIDSSLVELHDLITLIRDKEQGSSQYPVVLNLLATCMDKVGDTTGAIEACLRSQQLQPEWNGASEILKELLSRV